MKKLREVRSLKIEVDESELIRTLKMVIGPWIEASHLGTSDIMLTTLKNRNHIDQSASKESQPPIIYLYPERDYAAEPPDGFRDPIRLFENKEYPKLDDEEIKAGIVKKIKQIIKDDKFITTQKKAWQKAQNKIVLSLGDALWDSFVIEYDTDYYYSFLSISFSNYITYA